MGAMTAGATMYRARRGAGASGPAALGGWAWTVAGLIGLIIGAALRPFYEGSMDATQEAIWAAGTSGGVWLIGTLTLTSLIHGMMFVAPWPIDRGNGPALQRRRRGLIHSVFRGMGLFAAAVGWASLAFVPLFLIPDPSASDYLHWALPAAGIGIPGGLLVAHFADRIRHDGPWSARGVPIEGPEDGTS